MSSKRDSAAPAPRPAGGWGGRGLILGALLLFAGAIGYSWSGSGERPAPSPEPEPGSSPPRSGSAVSPLAARASAPGSGRPVSETEQVDAGTPLPQPWEVTRENTSPSPEGYVPSWKARPPQPDLARAPPPLPTEPPEPSLQRPAQENPGGVNGSRPARPIPGLE